MSRTMVSILALICSPRVEIGRCREVLSADDAGPQGVVHVVVDVGDAVGDAYDLTLSRRWMHLSRMVTYPVPDLHREV